MAMACFFSRVKRTKETICSVSLLSMTKNSTKGT